MLTVCKKNPKHCHNAEKWKYQYHQGCKKAEIGHEGSDVQRQRQIDKWHINYHNSNPRSHERPSKPSP